jgi:hypothetical protein
MRTTVRIDDDLMRELNEQARREGLSLTKLINRVLRQGIDAVRQAAKPSQPYREKTFRMGQPTVDPSKALALAASLEDSEVREKLARRK